MAVYFGLEFDNRDIINGRIEETSIQFGPSVHQPVLGYQSLVLGVAGIRRWETAKD